MHQCLASELVLPSCGTLPTCARHRSRPWVLGRGLEAGSAL